MAHGLDIMMPMRGLDATDMVRNVGTRRKVQERVNTGTETDCPGDHVEDEITHSSVI
jgi:hypothetical protein